MNAQRWSRAARCLRARHTATIVAETLSIRRAEAISAFAEWQAPQCVLGLAAHQYPPAYITWRRQRAINPDSVLPGGESLNAFARRARDAVTLAAKLATAHGVVLVVSHRLLIGAVAALHNGYRSAADIFHYASEFHLAPARLWAAAPSRENT